MNRLISAYTMGTQWGVNFTYDGFGNKTDHTAVAGKLAYPPLSITVNPANNRVTGTGVTYDNNGNLTGMPGGATFAYDVENRVTGADGLGYSYGADNRRVWDGSMYTFWSVTGQRIGRYAVSGTQVDMNQQSFTYMQQVHTFSTVETKLYFGGMLIGEGAGVNGTTYTAVVVDRLGSVRVRGTERYAYYPYGEERVVTAQGRDKFATYLRDANGVDYADQRYFTSQWGRFLTADPSSPADPTDSQSFNLYTYVGGDPINFFDPEGLERCGEISVNRTPTTVNDLLDSGSDLGLLATTVFVESAMRRDEVGQQEMGAIAAVIVNRYNIVNGFTEMRRSDGSIQRAPRAWGAADGTMRSIIVRPSQFQVWQGSDGTLTPGAQDRLAAGLRADADTDLCAALLNAIGTSFFTLQGARRRVLFVDPDTALAYTGFNSFQHTEKYDWEEVIGRFGSANRFYGIRVPIPAPRRRPDDTPARRQEAGGGRSQ